MSEPEHATCQAAVFLGAGNELKIREFAIPTPEQGEVLVRIELTTLCGSDLHTVMGRRSEPTPSILGHEALGRIEQLGGDGLRDLRGNLLEVGDRITWGVAASCGACDRCQSGLSQKCRALFKYGHAEAAGSKALSGGLAELLLLRRGSKTLKLNSTLPLQVACPANCATATVAACFRQVDAVASKHVLIYGAGMLGLTAAAMASDKGAAQIVIVDTAPQRLHRATRFGATHALEWSPDAQPLKELLHQSGCATEFDVQLELSGSADACQTALQLAAIGGTIVFAGSVMPSPDLHFSPEHIVRNWLTIRGVHNYAPQDLDSGIEFLERTHMKFPFNELVERSFALADINTAMRWAIESHPIRMAIHP